MRCIARTTYLILILFGLAACEGTGPVGLTDGGSGSLRTDVEIFNDTTFTATWRHNSNTVIRLAYEASRPVTDRELIEIAERLTGCQATGSAGDIVTLLVGGSASVRIPAVCGQVTAQSGDVSANG